MNEQALWAGRRLAWVLTGVAAGAANAADTVRVEYRVTSSWTGGFQGEIVLRNDASWVIPGWRLEFDAPFGVTSLWNAQWAASNPPASPRVALVAPGWDDGALSPGEVVTIGFVASPASGASPSAVTLNGEPVALGVDSPAPGRPVPVAAPAWPRRALVPYVDATAWPPVAFDQLAQPSGELGAAPAGGVKFFNLGFVVAVGTSCTPAWGGFATLTPSSGHLVEQVNALRRAGGDVLVSFGGAANVELGDACADVAGLVAAYQGVIDAYGLTRIDFDIEGAALANRASIDRRNTAIAQVQAAAAAAGRTLKVWFTLPVLPTGLTADGVYLVNSALARGVEIEGVNIMAMDYGDSAAPNPAGQMGAYAIQSAHSLHAQLRTAFAAAGRPLTAAAAWRRIGVTPMIGINDVQSEVFTLSDAAQLRDFAAANDLGGLFYWSLGRDRSCPGPTTSASPTCSGVAQIPYAFALAMAGFNQPACRADVAALGGAPGGDGQLSADDIVVFLDAFFAGAEAIADVASLGGAPTPDGQLTVDDILVFLGAFFAGCS